MKKALTTFVILLLAIGYFAFSHWKVREIFLFSKYELLNADKEINSIQQIDSIFSMLESLPYADLPYEYLRNTDSGQAKYRSLLKTSTYSIVPREKLHHRIVGHFRIKDFICKDNYYKRCILDKQPNVICLFNKKIFYKTLKLLTEMEQKGFDPKAIHIVNGHRHPAYNSAVGGAKLSRHIKGEAVDIVVGDINKNGVANKIDKDLVIEILEQKVIGDQGGIGLYPGTDNVHYDVRGSRARWNSY